MKVLIVDDNYIIQERLTEIFASNDHKAEAAGTLQDAEELLHEFRPDVIFLSTKVSGESAAKFLKTIEKDASDPKIFMLANNRGETDEDMAVEGWLYKPFKGTDILSIADRYGKETEKKERRSLFKNFFSKVEMPGIRGKEEGMNLKFGKSYLFTEDEPIGLRDACRHFSDEDVMFITSGTLKSVKEIMRDDRIHIRALSAKEGPRYMDGSKIGSVTVEIISFINSSKRPVIAIDDLKRLIEMNNLNAVLSMVNRTINNGQNKSVTLLASMRHGDVTDRDRGLLLHDLTEYGAK